MKKNVLVCLDRDGTLVMDGKYHLGSQENWKSLIHFCPKVVEGLRLLKKKIPYAKLALITNQPGVAVKEFPLLTRQRAEEVVSHILFLLRKKGIVFDGYRICGKASRDYMKKRSNYTFDKGCVGNFSCIKPKIGMITELLKEFSWKKNETEIYVVGDRVSDVLTGLNAGGTGILVPFVCEEGEKELLKSLLRKKKIALPEKVYIKKTMFDACREIVKLETL